MPVENVNSTNVFIETHARIASELSHVECPENLRQFVNSLTPTYRCSQDSFFFAIMTGFFMSESMFQNKLKESDFRRSLVISHPDIVMIRRAIDIDEILIPFVDRVFDFLDYEDVKKLVSAPSTAPISHIKILQPHIDMCAAEKLFAKKPSVPREFLMEVKKRAAVIHSYIEFRKSVALSGHCLTGTIGPNLQYESGEIMVVLSRSTALHPDYSLMYEGDQYSPVVPGYIDALTRKV